MTATPALRYFGALDGLDATTRTALLDRTTSTDPGVRETTAAILADVRARGDGALRELALRFDRLELDSLEVPRPEWKAALDGMDLALRRSMERSAANIASVHRAFLPTVAETSPSRASWSAVAPIPWTGSVSMPQAGARPIPVVCSWESYRLASPASVILSSPRLPDRAGSPAPSCSPPPSSPMPIGSSPWVARVPVAALAFGTETVPRVDRIVGPGNAFVAEAKLQVSGMVSIDSPAGPSELLVIADAASSAETLARELLAQAEHDPRACVVAVVQGASLGSQVRAAVGRLLPACARREIIEAALAGQGGYPPGSMRCGRRWSGTMCTLPSISWCAPPTRRRGSQKSGMPGPYSLASGHPYPSATT